MDPAGEGATVAVMDDDFEEFPWRAHELGEQPYDWETPFCTEPCTGCLVMATVELNKLNPLTAPPEDLEFWHEVIAVTAGEVSVAVD